MKVIEELISRGDEVESQGSNLLRESWEQDVQERLLYEQDQAKFGKFFFVP